MSKAKKRITKVRVKIGDTGHIDTVPFPPLFTKREYPCGCKAEGSGDVPAYCDTHGKMGQETAPFQLTKPTNRERHDALVKYLLVKVHEHDWHAVADVANDLRVLEASLPTLDRAL